MLFVLSCNTWNVAKPGASRGSTIVRFLPYLIYGAASLALIAGSHSQSGHCPCRLEVRSEDCSALSLKPKQDYFFFFFFNFPNTMSLVSPVLAGRFFTTSATWETHISDKGIANHI